MNVIIIPAYNPKDHLVTLIKELKEKTTDPIVVINDGSVVNSDIFFLEARQYGCHVVRHRTNQGKGASIKTGIEYANDLFEDIKGYITCDADGQHLPKDILNVSERLDANPNSLILGSRSFQKDDVPFKSRFGNMFSAFFFKISTLKTIKDTQTGLRGIPISLTNDALRIVENRYDYEMVFLSNIAKQGIEIIEIPIETVYLDHNSESHFRPIVDSYRIYKSPIRFAVTGLSSAVIDVGIFTILTYLINQELAIVIFIATVIARIISGIYNFTLNKVWSFRSNSSTKKEFGKYFTLYILQLSLSVLFVTLIATVSNQVTIVKIVVDSCLFIASYFIQKNWVFKNTKEITSMNL